MTATVLQLHQRPQTREPEPVGLPLEELSGRLVELSGSGASCGVSLAVGWLVSAQRAGEPVAWVSARHPRGPDETGLFAPDLAASGLDLEALPLVLAPDAASAGRAAWHLLRSGAFGLLVIDLAGASEAELPLPALARLSQLARKHDTTVLCLTGKPDGAPSLGSLVSLHAHGARRHTGDDRFECALTVQKDKRRGPGTGGYFTYRGPPGLR